MIGKEKKIGLTIGKFAPLHKGHQYLIERALSEMDELIVVIYDTDLINIPTEQRAKWIKELYPSVKVIEAKNPPTQYGLDIESVKIQMDYLENVIGEYKNLVTHFYSNEPYGRKAAEYMQIENRYIDIEKGKYPISGTIIRKDIEQYKDWIDERVYQQIKKLKEIK